VSDWPKVRLEPRQPAEETGRLACLDDEQVLGVDVAMLGEVEVLLRDENALCGDRVSACPYMQHNATSLVLYCAIAMASRARRILTAEEVPAESQSV